MVEHLANALSVLRILLTPVFIFFMFDGLTSLTVSVIIFSLAALSDSCDGYFARRFKTVSDVGTFLDPLADKILIIGAFGAFFVLGLLPLWFLIIVIVRDLAMTLLRTGMKSLGTSLVTSSLGKIKTFLQVVMVYGLFWVMFVQKMPLLHPWYAMSNLAVSFLLYTVAALTIYSALDYCIKNWQRIIWMVKR